MKDEKKHHGAVDESSLEQQVRNQMRLSLLCEKSEAIFLVLVGLMACRLAVRQNTGRFRFFKILYRLHR